jgi:hypothetical protein
MVDLLAPPVARAAPDIPPEWMDEGPDLGDAAEPSTPAKSGAKRPTLAELDRARIVWGDALEHDPGPESFVCDAFPLAVGRPGVICGEGGTKKSFLAQYFAACVSVGMKFLGRFEVQRGATLYMDFEQGLRLTRRRMQRFARGMGFSLREHKDRIAYIERPFFLDDVDKASRRLADLVKGFTLVVVDSAFRCAPRLRQNEAEAAIPFEVMTRASLETGATFCVVDHASTKRDVDARRKSMQSGNHHKLDGAGTVYALTAEKGYPTFVTCEREQLEGEYTPDFAFDVVDVPDPAAQEPYTRADRKWGLRIQEFAVEACKPPPKSKDKASSSDEESEPAPLFQIGIRIVEEVKKQPGISSGELLDILKIRKQRFSEAVNMLVRDGKMTNRTGKATRTEWIAS